MPDSMKRSSVSSRCLTVPTLLCLLTVAAFALTAWASDPWKDKEYKSWTQDDVEKVLYESPWVKMVEMGAPWLKGPTHYLTPLPSDCNGRPDLTKGEKTPTSWAMGATESIVIFQVTWQSSRTVRAAMLRQGVLCGRADAERGDELLNEPPDDFIITVHAPDMTPYDNSDEDSLIKSSYLMSRKTRKKISPESVQIARYGNSKSVYMLTLKFPKKTGAGEPIFSPAEKEIEFASEAGKFQLRTRFQPQKMLGKDGPDL